MKKVLSLVLVIAMVLSSMSFAFASTFEDIADSDYAGAIGTMKALGVIDGYPDGSFRPEGKITRAEIAKLLVEALGYGKLAGGASNFSDTNGHWADGHIAIASNIGLVVGMGDGTFAPDDQVSYEQAFTMVIRALGYNDASLRGDWPTNYLIKALELGLTTKLAETAGKADRGGVAQILYNALEENFVTVNADNDVNVSKEQLIDRLGEATPLPVAPEHVDADDDDYKGNIVNLIPYMYQDLTVYENKDGDVVYVRSVDSLVVEAEVTEDYVSGNLKVEYKDKDYTLKTTGSALFINGGEGALTLLKEEDVVTLVLNADSDARLANEMLVKGVVVRKATITVQAEEDFDADEKEILAFPENVVLPYDKEIEYDKIVVKGDADSLEDIKEDDVLTLYYGKNKIADNVNLEIVVSRNTIEGRVTRISGSNYYVDGKSYKLNSDGLKSLKVGEEGTFFLDSAEKIFAFVEEGTSVAGDYALVLDTTTGYQTGGKIILADPKVKLLTASGETITFVIDKDIKDGKTDAAIVTGANDLAVGLSKGTLVEYKVDSDKVIDELTVVTPEGLFTDLKTNVNSFNLARNAVIFSAPGGSYDDASVITADELDKEINAYRVRNVNGEIEVLIVTKGGEEEVDAIFAMITNDEGTAYDEDEEKGVKLFVAYVDGAKVEYLAHKDVEAGVKAGTDIVELTVTGGKLKDAKVVTGSGITIETGIASDDRVTNSITTKDGKNTHFLADDVVVYVLKWNTAKDALVFDKVGAKSDIRDKNFTIYDVVDADKDFDIVVVWPDK